ncbi:MAG: hypothetical protein GWN21_10910 [Gammaproteobacteria bacterium]|nr:hypothetical protein [Gammaproteobacteria bacterium]NIP90620.1 hypothetical protein [Gammaproteobacteria bacterium]NIR25243.1 hypothetical protein [Gammaproteobacteria bacterium]NIS06938.1 hypothetical protein [Gammaproteobacteria bacterium]NIU41908.1 hypothetical protein [Gammaproteobacteria bacterium]
MRDHINPYLKNGKRELILISPYFVPGDRSVKALIDKVERGIDVEVITNSYLSNNHSVVHAAYSRYREALLAGGAKLYEVKRSSRKERPEDSVALTTRALKAAYLR